MQVNMRTPLDKILRGKLEKTVEKAREIVEVAVTEALTRLGISEAFPVNKVLTPTMPLPASYIGEDMPCVGSGDIDRR